MKVIITEDEYIYMRDFGYAKEQFGADKEEVHPEIKEVINTALLLIQKVYGVSDEKMKQAVRRAAEDY